MTTEPKSREALERELLASEERFRTFMNHAPFLAFIKDAEGRFLFYNDLMAQRFGISSTEWLGRRDFDIWPDEIARAMHGNDVAVIAGGGPVERLEETTDANGRRTTWKVHKFVWHDPQGQALIGGIAVDMTLELARENALTELNVRLERLATLDALTGLGNRRLLDERIDYEFLAATRHDQPLSVVLLDIDDFKSRNDRFGHASGDDVLRRIGRLITETLRATDTGGRYGGEEFVVVLPCATGEGARIFAERLRSAMRLEPWPGEPVTASFGVATLDAQTISGRRLIAMADHAMYEAKHTGKDRVVEYRDIRVRRPTFAADEQTQTADLLH